MYKLDASSFSEAITILQQVVSLVAYGGDAQRAMPIGSRQANIGSLTRLREHVAILKCDVCLLAIDDLLKMNKENERLTYHDHATLILNISHTLRRELTLKKVYVVDPLRAAFYQDMPKPGEPPLEPLFGTQVATKFPSIAYEVDQSGKCYACDLSTASAFHSIRCLEAGIRAIARSLGIADPTKAVDRSWFNVLRTIKEAIDKKWPTSAQRMHGDGEIFEGLHGSLAGIQNPYRNATMHLDATYTAPEAFYIFEMVKGFMQKIASRMDEKGHPLA